MASRPPRVRPGPHPWRASADAVPPRAVAAETGAAITLFFASARGIPVSTTHTITGTIVGVGASQRLSAVRWGVAGRVVWAWVLTIPGAAAVAGTPTSGARPWASGSSTWVLSVLSALDRWSRSRRG